ncbi:DUF1549 domain-containing protein, partial [Akkermansiaceae bacterium]|nr:DUF1549 domain-containing protein [Akkermansiaceae bacterium]
MNSEIRLLVPAFVGCALVAEVWSKPDPNHWSFHEVAEQSVPDFGEENGIDGFLLQRLKEEGLSFSKRAEPENLLRRIFLDLTGLPPTPDEINSFEKSWKKDATEAYESAVERLLVSPRYGERWGQHWLDAVRFAETHGFEVNTPRPNAWPYRDYVIRAFNEDLPYDQFVFGQLAGDTVSEDAATGFLVTAAALLQGQVGKDDESIKRARQDELNEIVINTSATFLGLTVHCARCHDHKFDAISQKDYHRMQAIFGGVRYGNRPFRDGSAKREEEIRSLDIQIAHAEGGRSMPLSKGRSFDPVDIEIGPDGAIWISSWGRQYGAHFEHNKLANEGRIYRLWPKEFSPAVKAEKANTVEALIGQLGSHLPVWRSNAQEELINRGNKVKSQLLAALRNPKRTTAHETWLVWTLGRINPKSWFDSTPNQLIQSIRLAAFNGRMDPRILAALKNPTPRVRLAAVIALRELDQKDSSQSIIDLLAKEADRVVYYAAWGALMELLPVPEQKKLLADKRPQTRLAILLALLEKDALLDEEIKALLNDAHAPIAQIAAKRLGGKHQHELRGRPLESEEKLKYQAPLVVPFSDITPSSGHLYRTALLQPGTHLYTDRGYRITKVPPELAGLAFLQTACSDADATSGITVSLNLKYPSTVYFIDDARGEKLPVWARGKWKETPFIIEGDDPKKMKVYRADLPAGPLTLGSNRDDVRARKGNYLLAAQPTLLSSDGKLATESTILPLLKEADPARGRDLFFSPLGANCSSCHQVLGRGNNHAPDFSDIGSRADASTIIESIIKPSASIVEGFAAHQITTHAGKAHLGTILQETGRSVTLAQTGGSTIEISRKKIKARSALSVSAMPEGFAAMLTSQQLA